MTSTPCASGSARTTPVEDSGSLRAELRVKPAADLGCPLGNSAGEGTVGAHDVVCRKGSCEFGCECRASVKTDDGSRMVGREIRDDCICPVFRRHDCVSSIEAFERGELVVVVFAPSRQELVAVVEDLRELKATVELRSISRTGTVDQRRRLTIDADDITAKQREAIEVAFEEGYYESPREADLADLAERLGVSRSAVSQRLTAAESTLVESLYELESSVG